MNSSLQTRLTKIITEKRFSLAVILVSFVFVIATIVKFMPMKFHSDSAFYVLLAKEQMASGSMFPPGMCYSTALFVFTPNLIIIPLLLFMKDWILARSVAICIVWAFLFFSIYKMFVVKKESQWLTAAIVCSLIGIPMLGMPGECMDVLFQQGGWALLLAVICAYVGVAHYILTNRDELEMILHGTGSKRRVVLLLCGLLLITTVPNFGELRLIPIAVFPFLASFPLLRLLERSTDARALPKRLYVSVLCTTVLGIVIAVLVYRTLSALYWPADNQVSLTVDSSTTLTENIGLYIESLYSLYGEFFPAKLMSTAGIVKMISYLYATLCIVVFPVASLLKFRSFKSSFSRYVILFAWICNILLFALSVPTGALATTARYLIPTYFFNGVIAAICVNEIVHTRPKYEGRALVCAVIAYALITTGFFWKASTPTLESDVKQHQELVGFLKENDLEYGYATYWNAYSNTCFANGDVEFVAFASILGDAVGDPTAIFPWLTNLRWYDVEYHPGRCFILLQNGEKIDEKWYGRASEKLTVNDFTVLVYDKNINLYENA